MELTHFPWRRGQCNYADCFAWLNDCAVAIARGGKGVGAVDAPIRTYHGMAGRVLAHLGGSWQFLAVLAPAWISWHIPANLGGGVLAVLAPPPPLAGMMGSRGGREGSDTERGRWEASPAPERHGQARTITMPSMASMALLHCLYSPPPHSVAVRTLLLGTPPLLSAKPSSSLPVLLRYFPIHAGFGFE